MDSHKCVATTVAALAFLFLEFRVVPISAYLFSRGGQWIQPQSP